MRHEQALGPDNQHLVDCCRIGGLGNIEPEPSKRSSLVWNNSRWVCGVGLALPLVQGPTGGHCQKTRLRWWRKLPDTCSCHRLCVFGKLDLAHACTRNFLHRPIGFGIPCHRIYLSAGFVSTFQGSEIVVCFTRGSAAGTNSIRIPSR